LEPVTTAIRPVWGGTPAVVHWPACLLS
jgi:hypothetical protein